MQHCVLILADHYPEPVVPTGVGWPRLPLLEYWLARADAAPLAARDWRHWLAMRADDPSLTSAAPAGIVAAALEAKVDRASGACHYWLATPVHWVAGLDTIRLDPAGLLTLPRSVQQQLAVDFARVFAGSGWELIATGGRELLLSGPPLPVALTDDPARWLGMNPKPGLPRGAGAPALRTVGAEIEMWLYEHAVNRMRAAAGQLTADGLWLWGGGPRAEPDATPGKLISRGALYAEDIYARSLWQLGRGIVADPPSGWSALSPDPRPGEDAIVVLSIGGNGVAAELQCLERDWLQPLMGAWRAGGVSAATLIAGTHQWSLTRAARWRVWRHSRPWWESPLACLAL